MHNDIRKESLTKINTSFDNENHSESTYTRKLKLIFINVVNCNDTVISYFKFWVYYGFYI